MALSRAARHEARDEAAGPHLLGVVPGEGEQRLRPAARDDRRDLLGGEGDHVQLENGPAQLDQAPDPPQDRLGLERRPVADGDGHLARVEDGPRLEVFLDGAAGEEDVGPREARGHHDDDQRAQDDQLVADPDAHGPP